MKLTARDLYDNYFRVAQATPRGVVAKLCNIVGQLEAAGEKQWSQIKVWYTYS